MARHTSLDLTSYLRWTRRPSVAFACLLPLMAVYEVGILLSDTSFRNAAEQYLKGLSGFGSLAAWLGHALFLAVLVVAVQVWRRHVPLLTLFPPLLVESVTLAVLLGPVTQELVAVVGLQPEPPSVTLSEQLLLSLGAGLYEELVFRFLLLAGTFSLLFQVVELERTPAIILAVITSAVAFSLYHHLGPSGEPLAAHPLLFRFVAGIVLGALFVTRGLAVCVYLHAAYDVLFDLRHATSSEF